MCSIAVLLSTSAWAASVSIMRMIDVKRKDDSVIWLIDRLGWDGVPWRGERHGTADRRSDALAARESHTPDARSGPAPTGCGADQRADPRRRPEGVRRQGLRGGKGPPDRRGGRC